MTVWQPPAGWIEVDSAVDGVRVWAPAPEDIHEKDAPEGGYRCAGCGGTVAYAVAHGDVACSFCGLVAGNGTTVVGRDAPVEVFTAERIAAAGEGWALERRTLHCDGCGGELAVESGNLATSCPFCGSAQVLVREGVVRGLRPSAVVPFKVDRRGLGAAVQDWLGRGWMHPSDLARGAVLDKFVGIYLPFWTFGATIQARWEAEVGIEKTRRVNRGGKTSYETRIEWQWRNGIVREVLQDRVEVATNRVHARLLRKVARFDLRELVEYHPDLLAGWQAQAYDVGLPEAWDRCRARMRTEARAACHVDTGSPHVRNMSVAANFQDESWRYVLLPVHLCAYTWQDQVFHIVVNGQTGLIAGQRPVVWSRVWMVVAALFLPGLVAGFVGLPLLFFGIGAVVLVVAFALLVIAGAVSLFIVKAAGEAEGQA